MIRASLAVMKCVVAMKEESKQKKLAVGGFLMLAICILQAIKHWRHGKVWEGG